MKVAPDGFAPRYKADGDTIILGKGTDIDAFRRSAKIGECVPDRYRFECFWVVEDAFYMASGEVDWMPSDLEAFRLDVVALLDGFASAP